MKKNRFLMKLTALAILGTALSTHAQWITQSFVLKAGWNAVYLHVDATHTTLDALVGTDFTNPIQEIWLWNPAPSTMQFVQSPQVPTGGGTQWSPWVRSGGTPSSLQRLIGNAAYLVRVDGTVPTYVWNLKGKAVAPRYEWTTSGLNFLGFPTPAGIPPTFETFLAVAPELQLNGEFFRYIGGNLGTGNPQKVIAMRTTPVNRGEAFWARSGDNFNRYFGPFELRMQSGDGVDFGDATGQNRLRLRNLAASALTVTLNVIASEAPPAGQPAISGIPPMLVRGPINTTNLTYGYSNVTAQRYTWVLSPRGQPGSETDVVLGVNRGLMSGAPGSLYSGILRFADSLNLSQVDVPVSATASSSAGLWIGEASVNQVRHYLKNYEKDNAGRLVLENGKYVVASTNSSLGEVARPFPLRLLLHDGTNGNKVLLQRVYYGQRFGSNTVLTTKESVLDSDKLKNARRITATHLPWAETNLTWNLSGEIRQGTNVNTVIAVDYNDHGSNPFVHTYHPDHDNLNATFTQRLPQGGESFSLVREITLNFTAANDDFQSLTQSSETLVGVYDETVRINAKDGEFREFDVRGTFTLNRISNIPLLTE
jgi:hypothetical protein